MKTISRSSHSDRGLGYIVCIKYLMSFSDAYEFERHQRGENNVKEVKKSKAEESNENILLSKICDSCLIAKKIKIA